MGLTGPAAPGGSPAAGLLRSFVAVVITAGGLVLVAEVARGLAEGVAVRHAWLVAGFALLGLVAELRPVPVDSRRRSDVVMSMAVLSAVVVLAPGHVSVGVAVLLSLAGDVANRRRPLKVVFNAANAALTVAAAVLVLRLGAVPVLDAGRPLGAVDAVVIVAACAVMYLVNTLVTSTVVALASGSAVGPAVRRDLTRTFHTDGISLPLGPVLAVLAVEQPWLLPLGLTLFAVIFGSARFAADQWRDASVDPLTGLPNRREIDAEVERLLDRAGGADSRFALLMMDLDGFKPINDTFGHDVGDQLLIEVGARLRQAVGDAGTVGRLGGDEFAVVVPVGDAAAALALAERVHQAVARPARVRGTALSVRCSVGVAMHPAHGRSLADLARAADSAMYDAKQQRLGCLLADGAVRDAGYPLIADLDRTLQEGGDGLALAYQPVLHVRTGAVVGVEALLRWTHPTLGAIDPTEIVRQAESTPVIHALTDWVLATALDMASDLAAAGHRLRMAVNVSPRDMADPGLAGRVGAALADRGIEGHSLMVEITESGVLDDISVCVDTCQELRQMGIEVALDDFGTGHRSVAELRLLPVTMLKMDRSLVTELDTERGRSMLRGLVGLADVLGVSTIIEGVDSVGAQSFVAQVGCEQIQGFGVAPPMSGSELRAWLAGRASLELPIPDIVDVSSPDLR